MRLASAPLLAAFAPALLWPAASAAAAVEGYALGVIDDASIEGDGASVFGLDETGLEGAAFRIDFVYDTEAAPQSESYGPDPLGSTRTIYESEGGEIAWLELRITINGQTVEVAPRWRSADILDAVPTEGFASRDWMKLAVESFASEPEEGTPTHYRRRVLSLHPDFQPEVLGSAELPEELDVGPAGFAPTSDSAYFSLTEYDRDPETGEYDLHRSVWLYMDADALEATPMPEAGSPPVTGLGVALLAGLARRRRAPALRG